MFPEDGGVADISLIFSERLRTSERLAVRRVERALGWKVGPTRLLTARCASVTAFRLKAKTRLVKEAPASLSLLFFVATARSSDPLASNPGTRAAAASRLSRPLTFATNRVQSPPWVLVVPLAQSRSHKQCRAHKTPRDARLAHTHRLAGIPRQQAVATLHSHNKNRHGGRDLRTKSEASCALEPPIRRGQP